MPNPRRPNPSLPSTGRKRSARRNPPLLICRRSNTRSTTSQRKNNFRSAYCFKATELLRRAMARVPTTNPTLAQAAYDRLRADLLSGRLRPGEPVKISEIGAAFGTNVNAIREALSRLTSEGLVVATPQKGFSATPISAAELRDLTEVRIQIETSCLERSIATGDVNWETQIVAALHRLSRTPERVPGDPDQTSEEWARHHAAFHKALVAGCDSPWLLRIRETLYTQSERYRRLSVPFATFRSRLDARTYRSGQCGSWQGSRAGRGPHDEPSPGDDRYFAHERSLCRT